MLKALLKRMRSNEDGFTLVELLVVIVILGVLVGIGIPTYRGFIKRSHEAATKSELAAISNSMKYASIENIKLTEDNFISTLQSYLGTDDLVAGTPATTGTFLGKYTLSFASGTELKATPVEAHEKDRLIANITKDEVKVDDYVGEEAPEA